MADKPMTAGEFTNRLGALMKEAQDSGVPNGEEFEWLMMNVTAMALLGDWTLEEFVGWAIAHFKETVEVGSEEDVQSKKPH